MFNRLPFRFFQGKQPDPIGVEAGRIFTQHSDELLNQARAFVADKLGDESNASAKGPEGGASEEEREKEAIPLSATEIAPTYSDFIRFRRHSLAQKLVADTRLQEWQEELERLTTAQELQTRSQKLGLVSGNLDKKELVIRKEGQNNE